MFWEMTGLCRIINKGREVQEGLIFENEFKSAKKPIRYRHASPTSDIYMSFLYTAFALFVVNEHVSTYELMVRILFNTNIDYWSAQSKNTTHLL